MDAQDGSQQQQFEPTYNTAAVERLCERLVDRKMKEVKGGISINIDVTLIAFYVFIGVMVYLVLSP